MAVFGQNQLQIKAEKPLKTRLLFVFDGSQSMYGRWQQQQKIEVARRLLTHLVDSLANSENIVFLLKYVKILDCWFPFRLKTQKK